MPALVARPGGPPWWCWCCAPLPASPPSPSRTHDACSCGTPPPPPLTLATPFGAPAGPHGLRERLLDVAVLGRPRLVDRRLLHARHRAHLLLRRRGRSPQADPAAAAHRACLLALALVCDRLCVVGPVGQTHRADDRHRLRLGRRGDPADPRRSHGARRPRHTPPPAWRRSLGDDSAPAADPLPPPPRPPSHPTPPSRPTAPYRCLARPQVRLAKVMRVLRLQKSMAKLREELAVNPALMQVILPLPAGLAHGFPPLIPSSPHPTPTPTPSPLSPRPTPRRSWG